METNLRKSEDEVAQLNHELDHYHKKFGELEEEHENAKKAGHNHASESTELKKQVKKLTRDLDTSTRKAQKLETKLLAS